MITANDGVVADVVAVDGVGNVITANAEHELLTTITTVVSKFDSALNPLWSVDFRGFTMSPIFINTETLWSGLAVDTKTGNIYVGGAQNGKAVIQQILPGGTLGWVNEIGPANGSAEINDVVVAADDTIYAAGASSGQLPNQPATASGGGFELHYAADGTLLQALQSDAFGPQQLFVDTAGNSVINNFTTHLGLLGLDPSFNLVWSSTGLDPGPVATSPTGSVYTFGTLSGALMILESRSFVTGTAVWRRTFATQTATLNAVEGETWKGEFNNNSYYPLVAASSDSIYLTGIYHNTYQNGSSPPPVTSPCFVTRLDSTGNQVWFKQFMVMFGKATIPGSFVPSSIAVSGTKLVIGSTSLVFQISAVDGSGP
jgi:hypothetical protein